MDISRYLICVWGEGAAAVAVVISTGGSDQHWTRACVPCPCSLQRLPCPAPQRLRRQAPPPHPHPTTTTHTHHCPAPHLAGRDDEHRARHEAGDHGVRQDAHHKAEAKEAHARVEHARDERHLRGRGGGERAAA